jgi:hypothetical protein
MDCVNPMPPNTFGALVNWTLSWPTISIRLPHGVEKVGKRAGQRLDPRFSQRFADCILVVDHKSKMAALVSGLSTALLQCEELVAQINEGRIVALAPKFEIEQSTIESQSIIDITEFVLLAPIAASFSWSVASGTHRKP